MSMLAERRRKQKWSLNPRGNDWSQDSNKLGQKLMEKMGWSQGKGLGAKENGITQHIKVSYKNDSKGMGFKETDDQWTEHVDSFSDLLKTLNGNTDNNHKIQSLEEKSQKSRARVHYKKFTRGKDLSRYSEKELANIFGKKSMSPIKEINNKPKAIENSDKNFGVDTNYGGSMVDYFKKKIPNFMKNSKVENKNSESEDECPRIGFGFGFTSNQENGIEDSAISSEDKKKKNKKSRETDTENEKQLVVDDNEKKSKKRKRDTSDDTIKPDSNYVEKPSKKNKKRKLENGLSNPAFNPLFTEVKFEKHQLEVISEIDESNFNESTFIPNTEKDDISEKTLDEDSECKPKKSKKKKKSKVLEGISNPCLDENINIEDNLNTKESTDDIHIKKKKSKKKKVDVKDNEYDTNSSFQEKHVGIENLAFNENNIDEELNSNDLNEVKRKKSKKKKTKGLDSLSINEHNLDFKNGVTNNLTLEHPEEEKNKKKRKREKISSNADEAESSEINSYEVIPSHKLKKLKKDNKFAVENPAFNPNGLNPNETSYEPKFEVQRKKNQKYGIDNPALTDEAVKDTSQNENNVPIEEPVMDLMLNVAVLPVKPVEKKVKLNKKEKRKSVRFSEKNDSIVIDKSNMYSKGTDNQAFDKLGNQIEENITNLTKSLDEYQASMENELNQAKMDIFVGEMGDQTEDNQILPDGSVKLKFKYAKFGKSPKWSAKADQEANFAKKSYKNCIKGDISLTFKGTNLHEIKGYGNKK